MRHLKLSQRISSSFPRTTRYLTSRYPLKCCYFDQPSLRQRRSTPRFPDRRPSGTTSFRRPPANHHQTITIIASAPRLPPCRDPLRTSSQDAATCVSADVGLSKSHHHPFRPLVPASQNCIPLTQGTREWTAFQSRLSLPCLRQHVDYFSISGLALRLVFAGILMSVYLSVLSCLRHGRRPRPSGSSPVREGAPIILSPVSAVLEGRRASPTSFLVSTPELFSLLRNSFELSTQLSCGPFHSACKNRWPGSSTAACCPSSSSP